ncbi:MAG: FG-GAP-like repeat-containing protein, partial [Blastocatellia bacterium]
SVTGAQTPSSNARQKREEMYRLNNLGVALMEQYKHEDAVKQFKQALERDASFAIAHINLAMADYFLNDSRAAITEAQAALKLTPASLQAQYILGASYKKDRLYDEAVAAFNKVLAVDPKDPYTNIQIGQIYSTKQQYKEAAERFRISLEAEAYNSTAAYSLAQALIRAGNQAEGQKMLAQFQKLKASGYATTLGLTYGEQGKYAEAVVSTGTEAELVSKDGAPVKFVDASAGLKIKTNTKPLSSVLSRKLTKAGFDDGLKSELVVPFSSSVTLGDYDGDNKLDLLVSGVDASNKPFVKLLHNDGGKFSDVTEKAKVLAGGFISGAVFGDFDNDNKTDLLLFGYQTLAVWKNNGDSSFSDVTEKVGLPKKSTWAMTAAWVDADHDGDLDLFIGNFADLSQFPDKDAAVFPDDFAGEENKLFRNNGNGTFTDITAQTGLGGGKDKTTAVVCTDFNNQRDIDFLVVNYGSPVQLFSNQRDGSFKDMAEQVGLKYTGRSFAVAAGDLNKDNFTDFYFPEIDPPTPQPNERPSFSFPALFLSDGKGSFKAGLDGPMQGRVAFGSVAQLADYDNDGLLDILGLAFSTVIIRRNVGEYRSMPWANALPQEIQILDNRAFASGDVDGDGAIDFVAIKVDGSLVVLRNESAGKNYAAINLVGKTSNRSAVGVKAELRSGSLRQKLEVYASSPAPAPAGVVFGLGYRTTVDAVTLFWPAGIMQSELAIKASTENAIDELDRKGTSCPLLYAWNGSEFSFVTDFLGGSAIGAREPGNVWSYPDTDEYIRVTGKQLKEKDGLLSMRMNNQLEEVIFFDQVKLLAVDHPAETEIYPNERLMPERPYPSYKLYSVKAPRPPVAATDDKGT